MNSELSTLLLIEDNPGDARLIREIFNEAGQATFRLECVDRLATGLHRLSQMPTDLVLLDLSLPDSTGLETLSKIQTHCPEVPVVVLTGSSDEEIAIKALRAGAQDYLVKGRVDKDLLWRSVRYAIERSRTEAALRESEERFRAIFDQTAVAIAEVDLEGKLLLANPSYVNLLGFKPVELTGRKFLELIHPDERAVNAALFEQIISGQNSSSLETRYLCRDGSAVWVSKTVSILLNSPGQPRGAAMIIRDISRRKQAEIERDQLLFREQAARSEAELLERRFAFLAEVSKQVATLAFDRLKIIQKIARLAVQEVADCCAVYLLPVEGMRQHFAVATADPAQQEAWSALFERFLTALDAPNNLLAQTLRAGRTRIFDTISEAELQTLACDPEHLAQLQAARPASWIALPLAAYNHTFGVIALIACQAERRYGAGELSLAEELAYRTALALDNARLYEQAQLARAVAEDANRSKDDLLAVVSHDLRSPLNTIRGWIRLLGVSNLDQETLRRAIDSIEKSVQAQNQLIEDLLDHARIAAGKLSLNFCSVDPAALITAAAEAIFPAAEAKSIQLQVELEPQVGTVTGDPARLQQVLWNLLSNAIKFTPAKGQVSIRLTQANSQLEISVSDTGQGISPEFLPLVFDRFRQSEGQGQQSHLGLGLGLAIARQIIELHKGTITAYSEGAGKGATFKVSLPLTHTTTERIMTDPLLSR